jgi:hypothetical protein
VPNRLPHHSAVVSTQGEGYRLKDKRGAGLIHLPAGGVASRLTNSGEWTASGSPHAMHNSDRWWEGRAERAERVIPTSVRISREIASSGRSLQRQEDVSTGTPRANSGAQAFPAR